MRFAKTLVTGIVLSIFPALAQAQLPRSSAPAAPARSVVPSTPSAQPVPGYIANVSEENIQSFDARSVDVRWIDNRWQMVAAGKVIKDFGRKELEAREALRIVRELRLNQIGTVGTPRPVMEYWLSNGQAPTGLVPGLKTVSLETENLRVEETQGQWWLRDNRRFLFTFGSHVDEANQALAIIRRYGFRQIGFVGQATPSMLVFLAGSDPGSGAHVRAPTPITPRSVTPNHQPSSGGENGGVVRAASTGLNQPSTVTPLPLPSGRQLAYPNAPNKGDPDLGDRVPFDRRQVKLQKDNKEWKLMLAGWTLANFGSDDNEARRGLAALQFYHLNEQWLIGRPKPVFSHFLVNGLPPHGIMLGTPHVRLNPESIGVQKVAGAWALVDGNRVILSFGDKETEARQVLQVIQHFKCDNLCRLGGGITPAMSFFMKTR